jgi:hypothetical protein
MLKVSSPYSYLASLAQYVTADVSGGVRADALLLAGAEDHYVPLTRLADQINTLTATRSVTARVFTGDEQAQITSRPATSRWRCRSCSTGSTAWTDATASSA